MLRTIVLSLLIFAMNSFQANAELRVVASIKPVHSLVAAIMRGVGHPELILDEPGSPHSHTLKPSKAKLLAKAKVVFWIGPSLETFLQKSINIIAASATSVELEKQDELIKLPNRDFEDFENTVHSTNHDHGTHGTVDPHIWLDPHNAIIIANGIASTLTSADPVNAALYRTNAGILIKKLENLSKKVDVQLAAFKGQPFLTHHDAAQYFEARFGLTSKGALFSNSEIVPGAHHIAKITKKINELGSVCLFTEPQLSQKLVNSLAQGTHIKIAQLDPLGANIKPGPDLYFELVSKMAVSFHDCLSATK